MRLRRAYRFVTIFVASVALVLFVVLSVAWGASYMWPKQITLKKWVRVTDVRLGVLVSYYFTAGHGVLELQLEEHFSRDGRAEEIFVRPIGWQMTVDPPANPIWSEARSDILAGIGFSKHETFDPVSYTGYAWPDRILTKAEQKRLIVKGEVKAIDTESVNQGSEYRVPFWFVEIITGTPAGWIIFRWRRARLRRRRMASGCCVVCGYDLRASPGVCPECGAKRAIRPDAVPVLSDAAITSA